MRQILLEIYCQSQENKKFKCQKSQKNMGVHCFDQMCEFLSFTYVNNQLTYTNDEGMPKNRESFIGLGGEMIEDKNGMYYDEEKQMKAKKLWKEICHKKIQEAYEVYMTEKKILFDE